MYIGICMKFLELNSKNPYLNLAIEEYIFENCEEETFIIWQNEPCVVIGKNQNPYAEVKIDLCRDRDVKIVRRITGGGAVYHDLGNVNYSFISPSHKEGIDFAYFTKPIIDALSILGVDAKLSGRNDIVLSDGRKISGNAQHSKGGRVLHHGTLLFNSDLNVLGELLNVDPEKLKSKAVRSVRSRVANISEVSDIALDVPKFIDSIKASVLNNYGAEEISVPISSEIERLEERNASFEWIFGDKAFLSEYSISQKKRFDFGTVECKLNLNGDLVTEAKVFGDFFELAPISELEAHLSGQKLSDIEKLGVDISKYILGMSTCDFLSLIFGQ